MNKYHRNRNDSDSIKSNISRSGRNIYFFDEVNETSVMETIKHINDMVTENRKAPIKLIINSVGGSCYDGLALYDSIRSCVTQVITVGVGLVCSMGFIIYLAGDRRLSAKNTRFLNHEVSSEFAGRYSELVIEHDELVKLNNTMCNIVSERTGMSISKIKSSIKKGDNYFSAEEALQNGIVHEIIENFDN